MKFDIGWNLAIALCVVAVVICMGVVSYFSDQVQIENSKTTQAKIMLALECVKAKQAGVDIECIIGDNKSKVNK